MSARRLVRTAQAEEDLIEIGAYIAEENPIASDRMLDALDAKSKLLADYPVLA